MRILRLLVKEIYGLSIRAALRLYRSLSATTVIAACAMLLTGVQAWTTVYTAKIQTIPDLQFFEVPDVDGKPGCGDITSGIEPGTTTLCLENTGTGPARIVSIAATLGDETFQLPAARWSELKAKMPEDVASSLTLVTDLVQTQTISSGKTITLARFRPNRVPFEAPMHQAIRNGRFNLRLCYCNFYHDCQGVSVMPPNSEMARMVCESTQRQWWQALEPKIKLPSASAR